MSTRPFIYVVLLVFTVACAQLKSGGHKPSSKKSTANKKQAQTPVPTSHGLHWNGEINTEEIKLDVHKKTFSNGLVALVVENPHLPVFSFYTFYKVGSRYEDKGITGASHFLEHLMFKGAKKYGPGQFDSIIELNGGSNNAYTSMDLTVYYESLPILALNQVIDMEADRMQNLLLEPVAFEKERQVILEERKLRYENSPGGQLYLEMFKNMFKNTPYGTSTIGDVEDLQAVTREQIQAYFKNFYAPNNAIIVVVGDVKAASVLKEIEAKFGKIPRSHKVDEMRALKDQKDLYAIKGSTNKSLMLKGHTVNPLFSLAFPGEPLGTKRAYVMDIVAAVLGEGSSSYFVQKYVNGKNPKLTGISVSNYNLKHNGVFFISGELLKNVGVKSFEKTLRNDLKKSCELATTDRAVQKAKNQFLVDYYNSLQTNSGIASFVGIREAQYGDYESYKKELEILNTITTDEVMETCEELFSQNNGLFLSVWNKNP